MVGVNFYGRLGNQLFQFYFFLYLKSTQPKQWFFIPNAHHAPHIYRYFDLGPYNYMGTKVYSVFARLIPKVFKFKDVYIQNFHLPKAPVIGGNTLFHGFYQTDWYLNHTPKPLPVKIKRKYIHRFNRKYGRIFNHEKTIAIHIRRTDYLNYGKRDISLPIEYFKVRLAAIENLDSYRIFFCSDDMDYIKTAFSAQPNYIFSENDEITDFQILMNADIAIISNSSFAWWATYLSPKENTVIAPKNWMGFRLGKEHPKGVMTPKFKWFDVADAS